MQFIDFAKNQRTGYKISMDTVSKEVRSRIMASVGRKDTRPEATLCKALFALGLRYRKNYAKLPGKPDIVFVKAKVAVFVHGCFWHGHTDCRKANLPKSNVSFWVQKIQRNKVRDHEKESNLVQMGFKVITVWECDINKQLPKVSELIYNQVKMSEKRLQSSNK